MGLAGSRGYVVGISTVFLNLFRITQKAVRLRGPLANDPAARILHTLLIGLWCWAILNLAVITPFYAVHRTGSLVISILASLTFAVALALLHLGFLKTASLVYLGGLWLAATLVIFWNGGIHGVTMVFYIALPISAAWLLGYRACLLSAGVCLGSALAMALLEQNGFRLPHYTPGKPIATWYTILAAMIVAAFPVAHVLHILKEALLHSQSDREALNQYQLNLENLIEKRTAELLAANQAKSTFLANVSHELRTPLNSILGFSRRVRDAPNLPEEHRKDLEIVNRSGEHLLHLIDDVLDLAKIEAGRVEMENAPFDVNGLVLDVVEMMRERAGAKTLELLLNASPVVPAFVRSDAARLRQILINLLGNAVKFTHQGTVTLSVDARPLDTERVLLILEVQDTGIGIVPEDQARIFAPFVQVGKHVTQSGTGLGLSITGQFVKMMGGTISVLSAPGQGSLFRVELPVERAEESNVALANDGHRQVAGLAPGQPAYRILIVEDKRDNWLLLEGLLLDAAFQVRIAEDGAHGVETFVNWRPHLIWMDLRLPGKGGLETMREIRALEGGREVRIVALTASAFAQERDEVLVAGMDDLLRKPYRRAEIFDYLARHLGVRYLYRETLRMSRADPVAALRPEAMATLPPQLRKDLADALIHLDPGPIAEVILRVSEHDAELGAVLARDAEGLAYTQILNALQNSLGSLPGDVPGKYL
jgi:signal transduction histidine kinase/DNA-binding NarL/FixJ family response regulator